MNATQERGATAPLDAAAAASDDPIPPLASDAADVLRAWAGLLDLELALAQQSLRRLLVGAIALPAACASTWLGLCALLVAVFQRFTGSWALALLLGAALQLLLLAILLHRLRRWARDLTLPHSRTTLLHAMERMA